MAPAQREPVVVAGTTQSLQAHFCPLPATNWATRAYHACESLPSRYMVATDIYAAIVVSDYLYVDGGEVAIGEKPYPTNGSVPNPTYDPLARKSLYLRAGESKVGQKTSGGSQARLPALCSIVLRWDLWLHK